MISIGKLSTRLPIDTALGRRVRYAGITQAGTLGNEDYPYGGYELPNASQHARLATWQGKRYR